MGISDEAGELALEIGGMGEKGVASGVPRRKMPDIAGGNPDRTVLSEKLKAANRGKDNKTPEDKIAKELRISRETIKVLENVQGSDGR